MVAQLGVQEPEGWAVHHTFSSMPRWSAWLQAAGGLAGILEGACYVRFRAEWRWSLRQLLVGPTVPGWLHWINAACQVFVWAGVAAFALREGWGRLG